MLPWPASADSAAGSASSLHLSAQVGRYPHELTEGTKPAEKKKTKLLSTVSSQSHVHACCLQMKEQDQPQHSEV